MHIIKQIGRVTADIEHTDLGQLVLHIAAQELPQLEHDALNELANALVGLVHDELVSRGLL